jgi:hypothetical protein
MEVDLIMGLLLDRFTDGPLEKMGITGAKGQITKEGINTITDAIGYGALVPLASAGMEGRTPTADEYIQGVGLSLPFSAMRIFKNARRKSRWFK